MLEQDVDRSSDFVFRRLDSEILKDGLSDASKCFFFVELAPARISRRKGEERDAFPRVIRTRMGRIISMIGRDHKEVVLAQ